MRRLSRVSLPLLALCLAAAPARASVFDFMSEAIQSGMPRVPGDGTHEAQRTVVLNGFPLTLTTGRTQQTVGEVLDYYEGRYQGGAMKDLIGHPLALRRGDGEHGTLISIEVPDKETAKRVRDMKQDFLSAGPLRLVQARRISGYTEYLIAWSERPLPPSVLKAPLGGDAPGEDPPGLPRPSGTRIFSFTEPRAGYRLAIYEVGEAPETALQSAARRLRDEGWEQDPGFSATARRRGKTATRLSRGPHDVVVTTRPGQSGATQVVYLTRDL